MLYPLLPYTGLCYGRARLCVCVIKNLACVCVFLNVHKKELVHHIGYNIVYFSLSIIINNFLFRD